MLKVESPLYFCHQPPAATLPTYVGYVGTMSLQQERRVEQKLNKSSEQIFQKIRSDGLYVQSRLDGVSI